MDFNTDSLQGRASIHQTGTNPALNELRINARPVIHQDDVIPLQRRLHRIELATQAVTVGLPQMAKHRKHLQLLLRFRGGAVGNGAEERQVPGLQGLRGVMSLTLPQQYRLRNGQNHGNRTECARPGKMLVTFDARQMALVDAGLGGKPGLGQATLPAKTTDSSAQGFGEGRGCGFASTPGHESILSMTPLLSRRRGGDSFPACPRLGRHPRSPPPVGRARAFSLF